MRLVGVCEALRGGASVIPEEVSALERKVTEIFLELRDPVYRYLLSLLGSPEEAEDLAQEAFLRLYVFLQKGETVDAVRPWVFRVAQNLAMDRYRKREAATTGGPDEPGWDQREDPHPNAEESLLAREDREKVRNAMERLSNRERQCLLLRSQGLRYREIAEVLAIRIPTVQTLLGRAVKKVAREA